MTDKDRKILGKFGEDLAEAMLENSGYKILKRNFFIGHSDIDIIAEIDKLIVFVEVRTKSSDQHGMPEETLTGKKIKQMKKTAGLYLEKFKVQNAARLDAVCIIMDDETGEITHLKHYKGFI